MSNSIAKIQMTEQLLPTKSIQNFPVQESAVEKKCKGLFLIQQLTLKILLFPLSLVSTNPKAAAKKNGFAILDSLARVDRHCATNS